MLPLQHASPQAGADGIMGLLLNLVQLLRSARAAHGAALLTAGLGFAPVLGCSDGAPASRGDDDHAPAPECGTVNATLAPLRLLTREQYNNTVADLLQDNTAPARDFPPENTTLGFENNSDAHQASPLLVESMLEAAEGIAARAVQGGAVRIAACGDAGATAECARAFIDSIGSRAFRRPLAATERELFVSLFETTSTNEGFDRGIELVLQAVLQSPQFLYRVESELAKANDGVVSLGPFAIATRLSYFLHNTTPDAELFRAAASDELKTIEQVRAQAERLLGLPRARAAVADFHRQWLGLSRLGGIVREVEPGNESSTLGPSLQRSLSEFVSFAYWEGGGDLKTLLSSDVLFLDQQLAPLFGASAPASDTQLQLQAPPNTRSGLLTQPALLALLAHPNQSAPIQRGVFIREQLLCAQVPAPPPTVDPTPPDPSPLLSTRERFRIHTREASCAGCHSLFDDLGLGLENYDQLGRYREQENGVAVDASGEVRMIDDEMLVGPFDGAIQLSAKLAQSPEVSNCVATQWYRYATGRAEQDADLCSLGKVQQAFLDASGNLHELLIALTVSDSFRYRAALPEDPLEETR